MSSRLQRIEEKKSQKQAVLFIFLTILLIVGVIFLGIPSLIKMAIFLSNLHSSGQAVETKDTVPPAPPRIQPTYEATNSSRLTLKGFAEAGSTVKLMKDGQEVKKAVTDKDGQFMIDGINLQAGENTYFTKAVDSTNNESKPSAQISVVYDNTPPELEISNPTDGAQFYDVDKEVIVSGKTEVEAKITVNDLFVLVEQDGSFVKKIPLQEGDNDIKVKATDKAGNTITKSVIVKYSP